MNSYKSRTDFEEEAKALKEANEKLSYENGQLTEKVGRLEDEIEGGISEHELTDELATHHRTLLKLQRFVEKLPMRRRDQRTTFDLFREVLGDFEQAIELGNVEEERVYRILNGERWGDGYKQVW